MIINLRKFYQSVQLLYNHEDLVSPVGVALMEIVAKKRKTENKYENITGQDLFGFWLLKAGGLVLYPTVMTLLSNPGSIASDLFPRKGKMKKPEIS